MKAHGLKGAHDAEIGAHLGEALRVGAHLQQGLFGALRFSSPSCTRHS